MSFNANPQSVSASGSGSTSLMYAPPPSTLVASPYTTSLFASSHPLAQTRQRGHTKARSHAPHLHIPNLTHHRQHLLPGIEEQPF